MLFNVLCGVYAFVMNKKIYGLKWQVVYIDYSGTLFFNAMTSIADLQQQLADQKKQLADGLASLRLEFADLQQQLADQTSADEAPLLTEANFRKKCKNGNCMTYATFVDLFGIKRDNLPPDMHVFYFGESHYEWVVWGDTLPDGASPHRTAPSAPKKKKKTKSCTGGPSVVDLRKKCDFE